MNLHLCDRGGILVIDDHPAVLQATVEFLACVFPRTPVRGERGALDALDACIARMPQVVVLDIMLRGMNGLEAVGRIRELDAGVQVVMHSSFDEAEFRDAAARAGATAFVSKHHPAGLLPEISRLLGVACP
ncbi:response regulator [Caenimonas aquaedulcis]|uniref:Response regulator n=1 Tax=Caenimonas aquaedulcis TaxID=2793270 RepID=A0A931H8E1_9BURK|nr:response regulator [Caenimonas aquaedulcis]MBG9390621.1 response regulator [Caenimonas aquaedulcis]